MFKSSGSSPYWRIVEGRVAVALAFPSTWARGAREVSVTFVERDPEEPMHQLRLVGRILASIILLLAGGAAIRAEEGMWTFDNFPIARANQSLGTKIDQAWLDRVRLSSVRFGGCSAGIVSGDGLVITNNHCVATCVADLSTLTINYAETGFTP